MQQYPDRLLLTSDRNSSVLSTDTYSRRRSYTPYGFIQRDRDNDTVFAFNGQPLEAIGGHYLLGNGYRAYNPTLMRFNSPDSFSPFNAGGLNCYAYVGNEPISRTDPTGHYSGDIVKKLRNIINNPNTPIKLSDRQIRRLYIRDDLLKESDAASKILNRSASKLNLYESTLVQTSNALKSPRSAALLPVPKSIAEDINKHLHFRKPSRFQELSELALNRNHPDSNSASRILRETDDTMQLINFEKPQRTFSDLHIKLYSEYYDRLIHRPHLITGHSNSVETNLVMSRIRSSWS